MLGNAPGNSAFDGTFFLLELAAFLMALGLILFSRYLPLWSLWPILGLSIALTLMTPLYWYIAYPPLGGIDGAARLLFGVPALLVNVVMIGVAAARVFKTH